MRAMWAKFIFIGIIFSMGASNLAFGVKVSIVQSLNEEISNSVIRLQRENVRASATEPPHPDGFLIAVFTSEELEKLVDNPHNCLLIARRGEEPLGPPTQSPSSHASDLSRTDPEEIIGFLLVTDQNEFDSQLRVGKLSLDEKYDRLPRHYSYIYHVGIGKAYKRLSVGTALLNYAKALFPDGLISDVVDENFASLNFFKTNGFTQIGDFVIPVYRDYLGGFRTYVLYWNNLSSCCPIL